MKNFIFKLKIINCLEILLLIFLAGRWGNSVYLELGIRGILFCLFAIGIFAVLYVKRKKLIDRVIKELYLQNNQELKEKIPQLEAKRSIIASIFYLIKKMGLGKESVPKAANVRELADLSSNWVKKHLGEMMYRFEKIMPLFLHFFLPPIKAIIRSDMKKGEVFIGASIGCGMALFEQKIARWCNKNKFASVIIATDANKEVLLKARIIMAKKKIKTVFYDKEEKINLENLIFQARNLKQCVICFVPVIAEKFTGILDPNKKLNLVWFLNSREHTIEDRPDIFEQIKKYTENWVILELARSWWAVFLGNLVSWWHSPIFAAETEISITRNLTFKEWIKKNTGRVIFKQPCFVWIVSEGAYKRLKY